MGALDLSGTVLGSIQDGPGDADTPRGLAQEVITPMQSERSVRGEDEQLDQAILTLLLEDEPGLWEVGELVRKMGEPMATQDALGRMQGDGLIHLIGGSFVVVSRVTRRAWQLTGGG